MNLFEPLLDFLLPTECAECERPPSVYCEKCLTRHQGRLRAVARGAIHGYSLTTLDDSLGKALSAFKEKNQFAVARSLVDALLPSDFELECDVVVAIPSRASSFAKRGFVPAELVAKHVARRLGFAHLPRAVRLQRSVEDQASLSQERRATNLVGSMQASRALRGMRVLLVDDIVTTGATLIEGNRALVEVGGLPVGFLTIAETVRRNGAQKAI